MGLFTTIRETIAFRKDMKQLRKAYEAQMAAYRALTTEELIVLPDDELYTAAVERVCAVTDTFGDKDEEIKRGLAALPQPLRVVYVLDYYEREVNNGGLCQFFVNSSRNVAPFVSEALGIVTAVMHKELFDDFVEENDIDVNDLSSFICYDADEFVSQYDRFPFDDFDAKFYEYGALEDALVPYIRKHIEAF